MMKIIDVFDTVWYENIEAKMKPGDYIRIDRRNSGYSQAKLGEMPGNYSKRHISGIEKGRRSIGLNLVKKLSGIFRWPVQRYIQ